MDKLKKILENLAVTIFLFLLEGACYLSLFTRAFQNKDAAQITVLILMGIATVLLLIKFCYKKK